MAFNPNVSQPGALGQLEQLITFETAQDRQRTVMSHQPVMQNDLSDRRVKKICHRMTMQIDHEYPSLRHAAHLTKYLHHLLVEKMMREERAHHVVKLRISKRNRRDGKFGI